MIPEPHATDLLVVGAGPTGLAAACEARRHGLTVRVVERLASRAPHSKALVLHARTLEALELLDCAAPLVERGQRFRALHIHTRPGRTPTTVDLLHRAWGDTRYPFWLSIPQYETEQVLEDRAAELGVPVHWSTELTGLQTADDHVLATLRGPDGDVQTHRARWVLGCDGGRSPTRGFVGVEMARQDLGVSFALTDVHTTSTLPEDEGHMVWADQGLLLVVPMTEPGVWRLIAHVDPEAPPLDAAGWEELVRARSGIALGITSQGWDSRFRLSSGVASTLRAGRVFLLGDAAHVHSPVGGQGLNTGIQDAQNLVWKLALVEHEGLSGEARDALLDTYERERHPNAVAMVRATSLATRLITSRSRVLLAIRRLVGGLLLGTRRVQDRFGRGVGMLDLRTGPGARLPDPEEGDGTRRYTRVRPVRPLRLRDGARELLVRPDRVAAEVGTWPLLDALADTTPTLEEPS